MQEENENYENLIRGFRQFAKDVMSIAARITGIATTTLPSIDVIVVPDQMWLLARDKIPLAAKYNDNAWRSIRALAVYTPSTFAQRLKFYTELQQSDNTYNYDSHVDYDSIIFVHQPPKPTKADETKTAIELFASIASACFPLAVTYDLHCYGIAPITDPLNDTNAFHALSEIAEKLTPEQFATKYGP